MTLTLALGSHPLPRQNLGIRRPKGTATQAATYYLRPSTLAAIAAIVPRNQRSLWIESAVLDALARALRGGELSPEQRAAIAEALAAARDLD